MAAQPHGVALNHLWLIGLMGHAACSCAWCCIDYLLRAMVSLSTEQGACVCAAEGSFLRRFLGATRDMSPAERGTYLEHPPPDAPDIDEAHDVSAPPVQH